MTILIVTNDMSPSGDSLLSSEAASVYQLKMQPRSAKIALRVWFAPLQMNQRATKITATKSPDYLNFVLLDSVRRWHL